MKSLIVKQLDRPMFAMAELFAKRPATTLVLGIALLPLTLTYLLIAVLMAVLSKMIDETLI